MPGEKEPAASHVHTLQFRSASAIECKKEVLELVFVKSEHGT